jgi:hypothetical protein
MKRPSPPWRLATHRFDIHLRELAQQHGTRHGMLNAFDQIFQAAIKAGHTQDDLAVLNKFLR